MVLQQGGTLMWKMKIKNQIKNGLRHPLDLVLAIIHVLWNYYYHFGDGYNLLQATSQFTIPESDKLLAQKASGAM